MSLSTVKFKIADHLNFFRAHLLFFTFTPLVFSAIFYAANGATHVPFTDALFVCFSATTICGLATVDLSSLTGFQQAILFFLTSIGHPVVMSWVMVYIRRRYFDVHLLHIVESENARRKSEQRASEVEREGLLRRLSHGFTSHALAQSGNGENEVAEKPSEQMPAPIEPDRSSTIQPQPGHDATGENSPGGIIRRTSSANVVHDDRTYTPTGGVPFRRFTTHQTQVQVDEHDAVTIREQPAPLRRRSKYTGLGGFPYPTSIVFSLFRKACANIFQRPRHTEAASPPRVSPMLSSRTQRSGEKAQEGSTMNYFSGSFNAITGRNSKFCSLTQDDLEELAGVEYRGLNALLWIIAIYHLATQLLAFSIVAPYMSLKRWTGDLSPPNLHRPVAPAWYSAFQVMSAYTTSGMSLVDQSMIPFQEAYPLIFVCAYLILAGNLAFPCFLRFFIWSIKKTVRGTRLSETLQFLLDHPRRCYFYLFPSLQTWLLLGIVLLQNSINYFFFLILNLGEATFEAIPLGVRFAIGILQATAVRAAGFATTSLGSLAPSLLVWFVIMMYIGVYPIGLSVQATNVYEEKSLGIFEDDGDDDDEGEPKGEGSDLSKYFRYLAWHARKQLAYDMWWLGLVLFLLCIIERNKIQDEVNYEWFTVFALIFEMTSAYAGVGITLGLPYANYSFSGALSTLSKLILIIVMIRGRHRGLPVAIDRAVLLPHEYKMAVPSSDEKSRGVDEEAGRNHSEPGLMLDAVVAKNNRV